MLFKHVKVTEISDVVSYHLENIISLLCVLVRPHILTTHSVVTHETILSIQEHSTCPSSRFLVPQIFCPLLGDDLNGTVTGKILLSHLVMPSCLSQSLLATSCHSQMSGSLKALLVCTGESLHGSPH